MKYLILFSLLFLYSIGFTYSLGITSCSELFALNDVDHYLQHDIGKQIFKKKKRIFLLNVLIKTERIFLSIIKLDCSNYASPMQDSDAIQSYTSVFDGRGFAIISLRLIQTVESSNFGLIRVLNSGGFLKNLEMRDCTLQTVSSINNLGFLVGSAQPSSLISNCSSTNNLFNFANGSYCNLGGIVGSISNATIEDSTTANLTLTSTSPSVCNYALGGNVGLMSIFFFFFNFVH